MLATGGIVASASGWMSDNDAAETVRMVLSRCSFEAERHTDTSLRVMPKSSACCLVSGVLGSALSDG